MDRGDAKWRRELGANVKGMRESLGLSQLQLASRLIWHVSTLVKLERGELTPSEGQEKDIVRWLQAPK